MRVFMIGLVALMVSANAFCSVCRSAGDDGYNGYNGGPVKILKYNGYNG